MSHDFEMKYPEEEDEDHPEEKPAQSAHMKVALVAGMMIKSSCGEDAIHVQTLLHLHVCISLLRCPHTFANRV